MRKMKIRNLWLIAAAVVSLGIGMRAETKEVFLSGIPSTGGDFIKGIVRETGTSIVYDCGMYPAQTLNQLDAIYPNPNNSYKELKTPAMVKRIGDTFFLVDTYHNQVLCSQSLNAPISKWRVMASGQELPHAIASDGTVYLVTDTERHNIDVYEWGNGRYQNTQVLSQTGIRPHYIVYDEETATFFAWSAHTGEMYLLKRNPVNGLVCIDQIRQVKELHGQYIRSFTIEGDQILFPSGSNGYITVVDKETFEVQGRYPVTPEVAGMAYIRPIGGYYYISVSTDLYYDQSKATFIRVSQLADLASGKYEDIYDAVGRKGVPYYIEQIGACYYVTTHGTDKSLWRLILAEGGSVRGYAIY